MPSLLTAVLALVARRRSGDERGAAYLEYAFLVSLIAVACIVAVSFFGISLFNYFEGIAGSLG